MATTEKKTFVHGDFVLARELTRPPDIASPYAVEILREFSGSEFVGKVYHRDATGRWEVLRPKDAHASKWYSAALKSPHNVHFEMSGSGQWKVQNVRTESDIEGPYIAVALSRKKPA
jgi:hypothetical protein